MMLEETVKRYWKRALVIFLSYVAVVFVMGIISSRLNDIGWPQIWTAFGSWRVWTAILIPGVLVLVANLIPWQVFVPTSIVIFGAFLLISGLAGFESVGKAIEGLGDIQLLAFGTTVVAIGLTFMQLYRRRSDADLYGKRSNKDDELETITADIDEIGRTVESLDMTVKGLRDRIKALRTGRDETRQSGEQQY
jgi:hypothetical protein